MNTNVRITLSDEQRRQYKEIFGETASRNNIKMRVAVMFFKAIGEEKPRTCALKTVNLSDKAKDKIRAAFKKKQAKKR